MFVLPDGRLMVFGGANNGVLTIDGQIYNPVTNTWTSMASFPESSFGDGPTALLPDGQVLAGSTSDPNTYLYDPVANTWSTGPTKLYGDNSNSETWTLLPDGSVLSYDVNGNPGEAQRLDPATMTWVDAGERPRLLGSWALALIKIWGQECCCLTGASCSLGPPATQRSTPRRLPAMAPMAQEAGLPVQSCPMDWRQVATIQAADRRRRCFLTVTCSLQPTCRIPAVQTRFFEWDPTAAVGEFAHRRDAPDRPTAAIRRTPPRGCWCCPPGRCCWEIKGASCGNGQLYVYTPSGSPQAAWQPTITSVAANGDGSYTLTGTQLNGLSAGASHGTSTVSHRLIRSSNSPIVPAMSSSRTPSTGAAPVWPPAVRRRRRSSRYRRRCSTAPIP